ncbi:MAG: hypothetical protein GY810_08600 [Aureispira sp.]|nr:hypothetical protein [Aureispira sp.]
MLLDDNEARLAQGERLADEYLQKSKPWILSFGIILLIFMLGFWFYWIWYAIKLNMTLPPKNENDENLIFTLIILIIFSLSNIRFLFHYRYINNYLQTKEPAAFKLFLKKQFKIWKTLG